MESIEKLRELNTFGTVKVDGDLVATNMLMVCATKEEINEIADEIEREIAERYMLLPEGWTTEQASEIIGYWPKWDDGKPCMFGDRFTTPKYAFEENAETFDRLVVYARDHMFKRADGTTYEGEHGGYYEWNYFRPGGDGCEEYRPHHVNPRTIEDVLADFASKQHGITTEENDALIAECAEEIRELMEVGR